MTFCANGQVQQLEGVVRSKQDEIDATRREVHIIEESYRRQLASMETRMVPPPPITIERADPRVVSELAAEQGKSAHLASQLSVLQEKLQSLTRQQQDEHALQRRLDQALDDVEHLQAETSGARKQTAELTVACADFEALCNEINAQTTGADPVLPVPSRDPLIRLGQYATFLQGRMRHLVRERARLKEEIKTLGVDKTYLTTELQNKQDQVRRLSLLHQEEKALLLDRIEEEQRIVRRLQGVNERHFQETSSLLSRSAARRLDTNNDQSQGNQRLYSDEGEQLLSESMLAGGSSRRFDSNRTENYVTSRFRSDSDARDAFDIAEHKQTIKRK